MLPSTFFVRNRVYCIVFDFLKHLKLSSNSALHVIPSRSCKYITPWHANTYGTTVICERTLVFCRKMPLYRDAFVIINEWKEYNIRVINQHYFAFLLLCDFNFYHYFIVWKFLFHFRNGISQYFTMVFI